MAIKKAYLNDVVSYLKKNLKKGYTKESLKWALIGQGYPRIEVEKAINKVDEELSAEAPVLKVKPEIKYEIVEPKGLVINEENEESVFAKIRKKLGF
mgnify:FL=1